MQVARSEARMQVAEMHTAADAGIGRYRGRRDGRCRWRRDGRHRCAAERRSRRHERTHEHACVA